MIDNNKYKKWILKLIIICVIPLIFVGLINVVVDPYFHFHKPITSYRLSEERYINDGITRHFDYDAMIIGNSLTQNFKTSEFDKLFGTNSIKTPFSGAGYGELWGAISRALSYNDDLKLLLVGFDFEDLGRSYDWKRYDSTPDYLYDKNIFNDLNYMLSKETLYRGSLYNILQTIKGVPSTTFDEYSSWERKCGYEEACSYVGYIDTDEEHYDRHYYEEDNAVMVGNIQKNVIPVLENNLSTKFILVVPPSSVAKWAEYYKKSEINFRISYLKNAFPMLLQYKNVEIYAFDDAYEITTDLNRYSDSIHYDAGINEWMLEEIAKGNHRVTMDNYQEYIANIRKFYNSYDYGELNKYIK